MRTTRPLAALLLLGALAAPAPAQSVLVYDPSDPSAYAWMQQAVDAAADGDTILARAGGIYFSVEGKSLTIVADSGVTALFKTWEDQSNHSLQGSSAHVEIRNLAPGQRVVLRGLDFYGLDLLDDQGQVWVEDADVRFTSPAMRALDCDDVVLQRVQLKGPNSAYDPFSYFSSIGGSGLLLDHSRAALHGVTASGGNGLDFMCTGVDCFNGSGFSGLAQEGSTLWIANAQSTGGEGGEGGTASGTCYAGAAGGHGLLVTEAGSAQLAKLVATGGAGGTGPDPAGCTAGTGGDGPAGSPVKTPTGTAVPVPGTPLDLATTSPVREGQPLGVTVTGVPGTPVLLLASITSSQAWLGALDGPLLASDPTQLLALGPLPPSGSVTLAALVPELGPGVQVVGLTLQVLGGTPGNLLAGGASSVTVLDGSF